MILIISDPGQVEKVERVGSRGRHVPINSPLFLLFLSKPLRGEKFVQKLRKSNLLFSIGYLKKECSTWMRNQGQFDGHPLHA